MIGFQRTNYKDTNLILFICKPVFLTIKFYLIYYFDIFYFLNRNEIKFECMLN